MTHIGGRIGPFHYNPAYPPIERTAQGITFLVGIATAYNALGLIGTEHNGIFILDDTNKQVVLDREAEGPSGGFGPYPKQEARRGDLLRMSDVDFIAFIVSHPRYRGCL